MARNASTKVGLNAKIQSVQLKSIELANGSTSFIEGQPIALDANGKAAKAAAPTADNAPVVWVNFVDSGRTDVSFTQTDGFDSTAPKVWIQSGGLTGIQGPVEIGLLPEAWHNNALPALGTAVSIDDTTGKFRAIAVAAANGQGTKAYGVVHQIKDGRAWFIFHSVPFVVDTTPAA